MKQRFLFRVTAVLAISIAAASAMWGVAAAQGFRSGNHVVVGQDETVNSTLWVAGRTLDIAGHVNGDVFCAGQNVTVSGNVEGDVICASQTIVVSGTVSGDVRLLAQTATLSGEVGGNATVGSQSFTQDTKSNVGQDMSVGATDVVLNGSVGRDAALGGVNTTIGGKIGRDIQANVQNLSLLKTAQIAGNLSYTSKNNAQIASGATIGGKTTKSPPQEKTVHGAKFSPAAFGIWSFLYILLAGLLTALVIILLFPQAVQTVTNQAVRKPWMALLIGIIAMLVAPALIIFLLITLIGIPLALLLLAAWLIVQGLAGIMFAYYLGRMVWRQQRNAVLVMLVGVALLIVLYFIPIIGFIAFLLAMLMGTGMLLMELNHRRPRPRYHVE